VLPWESEEDGGASGGATSDETFPTAETSSDGVKNSLTEKQERESSKAVHGRSVGGVNAESSVVVLIGLHCGLKSRSEKADLRNETRLVSSGGVN
jgi:hypothetical protein